LDAIGHADRGAAADFPRRAAASEEDEARLAGMRGNCILAKHRTVHLVAPDQFLPIVRDFVRIPRDVVLATGPREVAGGPWPLLLIGFSIAMGLIYRGGTIRQLRSVS
jgi:hypothetical protein